MGVSDQAGGGGKCTAPQELVGSSEPWLGILLVRVDCEAGEGLEIVRGPLPHVADHLPAAEGTVTGRQQVYRNASNRTGVEMCPLRGRRIVAPRESAFLHAKCL